MDQDKRSIIYDLIYEAVKARKRPLLIGINGAYTSGKTTYTHDFEQFLMAKGIKTQVIHYDDFHRPFDAIPWNDDTEIDAFYNHAFDPEKLVFEVLAPLKAHGRINKDILCVDLNTNQFTNKVHLDIDERTIVLLEGVLLFRPPLLDYLDYKIFLDISPDEMLYRARQRDVPRFGEWIMEKFTARYIPIHKKYLIEWDPQKASDIIINNNDFQAPSLIKHNKQ